MQPISNKDIKKALKSHDKHCFELLFKTYYPYVYKIAMIYLQHQDDAKDAVQISMTKLWESGKNWNEELPFKAFLRTITVNTCIDILRKRRPGLSEEAISEQVFNIAENAILKIEYKEIIKFIESMDFPAKEVIKLHIIEGYTHAEIAGMLGISEKYSRVVLTNAKKKILSNFLEETGIEKQLGS